VGRTEARGERVQKFGRKKGKFLDPEEQVPWNGKKRGGGGGW